MPGDIWFREQHCVLWCTSGLKSQRQATEERENTSNLQFKKNKTLPSLKLHFFHKVYILTEVTVDSEILGKK